MHCVKQSIFELDNDKDDDNIKGNGRACRANFTSQHMSCVGDLALEEEKQARQLLFNPEKTFEASFLDSSEVQFSLFLT